MVTAENYPEFRSMIYKLLSDMENTITNANGKDVSVALNELIETVGD